MLKQFTAWVVLPGVIVIALSLKISTAGAVNASGWIDSSIFIRKQANSAAVPSSLNGNIDCVVEDNNNCALPTTYGTATQNSLVKLNGTSTYLPVNTYIENRPRFIPVPNSNTVISYTTEPAYGAYFYFNYNFSSSIKQETDFSGPHYKITRPPDGVLADRTSHRLAADYGSISFSQNGQWMVVSDPNEAVLRVNLSTFEVLPFATGFNYTVGIDPSIKTAISNDGRYISVASQGFSNWKIYDAETCGLVPAVIYGPVKCQSRDLKSQFDQQITGYNFAALIRFVDDDALTAYINHVSGGSNKTARFIISNHTIANQLEYLALGDSYIVGEGAFDYQPDTDTSSNHCHLSYLAYPYLIGHDLNYNSYHSVACSGAKTGNLIYASGAAVKTNGPQATGKDDSLYDSQIYDGFLPGYRAQINFVSRYQPKVITLSIGGNDMGFASILKSCVDPRSASTCYRTYEDRKELVNLINSTVYPKLLQTYQQVKSVAPPDSRIYIIGYPQIAKPDGDCALNVHLNNDEIKFSRQLIAYLDSVIKTAAAKIGAYYVDNQDALNGHRLCEAGPGSVAVNGLTAGNDAPSKSAGPIGNESYHPNPFGYELLENTILSATQNLTAPMPEPDKNTALPGIANIDLLNAEHSNRQIKTTELDDGISKDLVHKDVPLDVSIIGAAHSLTPNSNLQAEIHSIPVSLGAYSLDQNGNLSSSLIIPNGVPAGYHTLHFYGTDISGQPVDIYKYIYLAHTADDLDGNGIMDSAQGCVGIEASGQDYDKDGIDDACDPNISQPPLAQESTLLTSTTSKPTTSQASSRTTKTTLQNTSPSAPPLIQPKVLSASTASKSEPAKPTSYSGTVRMPGRDLVYAGLVILLISTLAWVFF